MNLMFRCCKPSAREADVRAINIDFLISSPFLFDKFYHCLNIPNETVFWLWGTAFKNFRKQSIHSGMFSYRFSLYLFLKSRNC